MTQKRWHTRIVEALEKIAPKKGFDTFYPYKVYINDHSLFYRPDSIWYRGKNGTHIVIWEVENNPNCKVIAGDIALAMRCKSRYADWYNLNELGSKLRKSIKVPDIYDSRKINREISSDYYHFKGDEIGRLSFFSVYRYSRYYGRYIDAMTRRQWGQNIPFHLVKYFECNASSVESACRSLSKQLDPVL